MNKSIRKLFVVALASLLLLTSVGCSKKQDDNYDKGYFFNYGNQQSTYNSTNWKYGSNVGKLDNTTVKGIRNRYTTIKGNNKDTVTILVFMCGSDLESKGAMGSYDLQEMANATIGKNVNLLVYTGGTTNWHISQISTKYNQIYRVVGDGQVECLVNNAGSGSMVDPSTLVSFIEFGTEHFPANRYELIMWDHGAGSVSGYGHDEKFPRKGSMTLDKIDEALTETGVKFDFIGFDACLMANVETAMMLTEHADYLIASEESEPGIGWYYTDWLTALSKNTSMPTIEIGKNIADSFVKTCASETPKQPATLSVIDLAEVEQTISKKLNAFAKSTTELINNNQYKTVVSARTGSREFAVQSKVDLVDLVDFANGIGTSEANELTKALLSCVKYNNTTNTMSNAYGLSIYFPYRSTQYVKTVLNTYDNLEFSSDYSDCIRSFVGYQATGQVSSSNNSSHNATQSFNSYNGSQTYSNQNNADAIVDLLSLFLTGGTAQPEPQPQPQQTVDPYAALLNYGLNALLNGMFNRDMAQYVVDNHFDVDLNWKNGKIKLTEKQWSMVEDLKLNMFIDDGNGYIDLGTDNVFDVDDKGNLLKLTDVTWLAASTDNKTWTVVPYYYLDSTVDGDNVLVNGRIPCLLNGQYADLLVYMDNDTIEVVGARYNYRGEVDVVAKTITELTEGDVVQFVCDYYDYDGNFVDNYTLSDPITITTDLYLGDVDISKYNYLASYQFVDIYGQNYWTVPMNK